jgi:hypothetical protein
MSSSPDEVPPDVVARYRAAAATQPDIEIKGGRKLPHTSVNGRMYSSLTKDGRLGVRLSPEDREAFVAEHGAAPFVNYGATIAEHVEVPAALLDRAEELGRLLASGRRYTESLPPKG